MSPTVAAGSAGDELAATVVVLEETGAIGVVYVAIMAEPGLRRAGNIDKDGMGERLDGGGATTVGAGFPSCSYFALASSSASRAPFVGSSVSSRVAGRRGCIIRPALLAILRMEFVRNPERTKGIIFDSAALALQAYLRGANWTHHFLASFCESMQDLDRQLVVALFGRVLNLVFQFHLRVIRACWLTQMLQGGPSRLFKSYMEKRY